MEGYWTGIAAQATVDWCEPNYVYSPWVAEWWNTLTSLVIALGGLVGAGWSWRSKTRVELRFVAAFLSLALVGLGSAAFHGTLLRWAQAVDELPMMLSSMVFIYILRFRRDGDDMFGRGADQRARRGWILGLTAYAAGYVAAYFLFADLFVFFVGTYALSVVWISVQTYRLAFGAEGSPVLRRLFFCSIGAYVGGFVVLWIPEHVLLGCAHPLQHAQLHALFHLTSALGTYAWVLMALIDRHRGFGAKLTFSRPVPMFLEAA